MTTHRRTIRAVTLAALAAVLLVGCSEPYHDKHVAGGVNAYETTERLLHLPGVQDVSVSTAPWWDNGEAGFGAKGGMDVVLQVRFDPARHLVDPGAALVSLVKLAWSTNLHYPVGHVDVLFDGGVSMNYSWGRLATAAFGSAEEISHPGPWLGSTNGAAYSAYGRSGVRIPVDAVAEHLGPWPAAPPTNLSILLADGPPAVIEPDALATIDVVPSLHQPAGEHRCWQVLATGSADGFGQFAGDVHVELAVDGTPTAWASFSLADPRILPTVCTPHEPAATARITATVTTTGDPSRFRLPTIRLDGTLRGLRQISPWHLGRRTGSTAPRGGRATPTP